MPFIAIYQWSSVDMPDDLDADNIKYDLDANHPDAQYYDDTEPTWTGQTYTFAGGTPTKLRLDDDDDHFEDGYTETGAPQVLKDAMTLNGTTYPAGSVVEAEFSLLDDTGLEVWVVRIDGENVGFTIPAGYDEIPPGTTFSPTQSRDGAPQGSSDGQSSREQYSNVACFTAPVPIDTPDGPRRAGSLRPGDMVLTLDNGAQPVLWAGRTTLRLGPQNDGRRPIRLRADCLAPGCPASDISVSPQHRILIAQPDGAQAFVPARGLLPLPGVSVARGRRRVTFVHLLLPRHEVLLSAGLATESLFPGRMSLLALGARGRASLDRALPGLDAAAYGPLARPGLTRRQAEAWARARKAVAHA